MRKYSNSSMGVQTNTNKAVQPQESARFGCKARLLPFMYKYIQGNWSTGILLVHWLQLACMIYGNYCATSVRGQGEYYCIEILWSIQSWEYRLISSIRPSRRSGFEAEEVLLFLLCPVGAIGKKVWLWRTVEIRRCSCKIRRILTTFPVINFGYCDFCWFLHFIY